jgi:hypothetical protein
VAKKFEVKLKSKTFKSKNRWYPAKWNVQTIEAENIEEAKEVVKWLKSTKIYNDVILVE